MILECFFFLFCFFVFWLKAMKKVWPKRSFQAVNLRGSLGASSQPYGLLRKNPAGIEIEEDIAKGGELFGLLGHYLRKF